VLFCALGALQRAAFEFVGDVDHFRLSDRATNALGKGLMTINDEQGRQAALRVFDAWLTDNMS
jgi:hypothetical protein